MQCEAVRTNCRPGCVIGISFFHIFYMSVSGSPALGAQRSADQRTAPALAGHTATSITQSEDGAERLLVFGGFDGVSVCNEAYVFSPADKKWFGLRAGTPPAPRAMHAAALLAGTTLVVHGGWGGDDVLRADTCVLNLQQHPAWDAPCSFLSIAPGPSARQGHTMTTGAGDEVLLFGGDVGNNVSGELWSLTTTGAELSWHLVASTGTPPPPRSGHTACALPGGLMLIFGGRAVDGSCLGDLCVFSNATRRWSQPKVVGDVPRPRWATACCALPAGGPHGTRVLLDGGRDADGWVNTQTLIDAVVGPLPMTDERRSGTPRADVELRCHTVRTGGHPLEGTEGFAAVGPSSARSAHSLSGHSVTACGSSAWIVGGSLPDGRLSADTQRVVTKVVRWVCPSAGALGCKFMAGRDGRGKPQLFKELVGPPILASTHTATRCGDHLYVLGGHESPNGLLAQRGGGLLLSVLHVPSLSWKPRYEALHAHAPKIKCGHSAALLPGADGIAVFGGVRSNAPWGAGAETRLSNELHVLKIGKARKSPPPRRRDALSDGATAGDGSVAADDAVGAEGDEDVAGPAAADCPPELSGEPTRWAKAGGAFFTTVAVWPAPRSGHSATCLPAPYGWSQGMQSQGAMLIVGGYSVDEYMPDGPEGALSNEAFLLRPAEESWLKLTPTGSPPTPRALHAAALLTANAGDGEEHAGPLLRVCVFGGWGLQAVEATASARIASARYMADLFLLTFDPAVEGACGWTQLRPSGVAPTPRAGAAAVATTDGGVLIFGGHDDQGAVSTDCLELCALPGKAMRFAESEANGRCETSIALREGQQAMSIPAADVLPSSEAAMGGSMAWLWPDFVGQPPPPAARFSATAVGSHVLVLVPPLTGGDESTLPGYNQEPGTALYMLAADGWTDDELQSKYRRVRQREATISTRRSGGAKAHISFGSASDTDRTPFVVQRAGSSMTASGRKLAKLAADNSGEHSAGSKLGAADKPAAAHPAAVSQPFMSTSARLQPKTRDEVEGPSPFAYAGEVVPPGLAETRETRAREAAAREARVFLLPQAQRAGRVNKKGAVTVRVNPGAIRVPTIAVARVSDEGADSYRAPEFAHADSGASNGGADPTTHELTRPPPFFASAASASPGPGAYSPRTSLVHTGAGSQPHAAWRSGSPRLEPTCASASGGDALAPQDSRQVSGRRGMAPSSAPPRTLASEMPQRPTTAPEDGAAAKKRSGDRSSARSGAERDGNDASEHKQNSWRYWAPDEIRQGIDDEEMQRRRVLVEERKTLQQLRPRSSRSAVVTGKEHSRAQRRFDDLAQPRWKLSARVQRPASHESPRDAVWGYPSARASLHPSTVEQPWPRHAERTALRSPRAAVPRVAEPRQPRSRPATASNSHPPPKPKPHHAEESALAARERALALALAIRVPVTKRSVVMRSASPIWRGGNWSMVDDRNPPPLPAVRPSGAPTPTPPPQQRPPGDTGAQAGCRFAGHLLGVGGAELMLGAGGD